MTQFSSLTLSELSLYEVLFVKKCIKIKWVLASN